jgi:CYTH domain-containing protein
MIELELTYLAKSLPDLKDCDHKEIIDIFIPTNAVRPTLRIRKSGDNYEITKKIMVNNDPSHHTEETTTLTAEEFEELSQKLEGKRTHKHRYYYPFQGKTAEIDIFQGKLKGLVVIEFEFNSAEEKNSFKMPDFCLADITPEEFIAGGMICGKEYADVEKDLARFNYKKLFLDK